MGAIRRVVWFPLEPVGVCKGRVVCPCKPPWLSLVIESDPECQFRVLINQHGCQKLWNQGGLHIICAVRPTDLSYLHGSIILSLIFLKVKTVFEIFFQQVSGTSRNLHWETKPQDAVSKIFVGSYYYIGTCMGILIFWYLIISKKKMKMLRMLEKYLRHML